MSAKSLFSVAAFVAVTGVGGLATTSALAQITIQTVPVGDPGNAADSSGQGAVAYSYNIGKFEVTAGQYAAFLNAVARSDPNHVYNTIQREVSASGITRIGLPPNYAYIVDPAFVNRPVNYVAFWSACRFANWMHNGQPTGAQDPSTTEDGAYTLTADAIINNTVTRNAGARWAITSEDEWYKAAFYKGGNTNAGYWLYPTRSNTQPGRDLADPSGNNANYLVLGSTYPIAPPYYSTICGQFQNSPGPYGTFDQGGNVWEWNETILPPINGATYRGGRAGGFNTSSVYLKSDAQLPYRTEDVLIRMGFRVVQLLCAADFNSDGSIDFFDYLDFVAAFAVSSPSADFNHDSIVDFFDYLDFVQAFSTDC